jgi:hypothetical protein
MERLGFADDIAIRWEIAGRMASVWLNTLQTPEKLQEVNSAIGHTDEERISLSQSWSSQVASWDRASILLTDNEKLIARHILWRQSKGSELPSANDISAALGIGSQETDNGIRMLAWLGFLDLPEGRPASEYALAENHVRFADGLGFSFHTVTLDPGKEAHDEKFGIP